MKLHRWFQASALFLELLLEMTMTAWSELLPGSQVWVAVSSENPVVSPWEVCKCPTGWKMESKRKFGRGTALFDHCHHSPERGSPLFIFD